MSDWLNKTHLGDCRELMRKMVSDGVKVQCVVTSPPYYGLRDYGVSGQIGLEPTLYEWVDTMVEVFDCVREVLADDGTLWLNLGDSYATNGGAGWQGENGQRADRRFTAARNTVGLREATRRPPQGLKAKDLMGQPWRVAFALQNAGWWLRSEIIWHKPSPMPESVKDRPTKAHEQIFLLVKSDRYYYDAESIKETAVQDERRKTFRGGAHIKGSTFDNNQGDKANVVGNVRLQPEFRNARTVWTIASEPTSFAHFACFPREIPKRCILAGSRPGDIVLDPFMGSGTTAEVATSLGRNFIGCELNQNYIDMHDMRRTTTGMAI